MPRSTPDNRRLVALFLLGAILFNYPLLAVFNIAGQAFGIPVVYAYIFVSWAMLIALFALVVESAS
jgi:hypothetical protein